MNDAARLPFYVPMPWLVIGAILGIALVGVHHIGHIIILLIALGFAAKWACRWHAANGGTNGAGPTIWPSCSGIWGRWRDERRAGPAEQPSSGNSAFDEYRREMLRRLEQDHQDFRAFLERLRHAKDKAEFDQFMADRDRPSGPWPNTSP